MIVRERCQKVYVLTEAWHGFAEVHDMYSCCVDLRAVWHAGCIDLEAEEEKGYGEAESNDRLASEGGEVGEEDVGGDLDAGGDGGDKQPGQEEEGARKEDAEEEREAR